MKKNTTFTSILALIVRNKLSISAAKYDDIASTYKLFLVGIALSLLLLLVLFLGLPEANAFIFASPLLCSKGNSRKSS